MSAKADREHRAKLGQQCPGDLPLICKLRRTSASQTGELIPDPERTLPVSDRTALQNLLLIFVE